MIFATMNSPVGVLTLTSDGRGLSAVLFENHKNPRPIGERGEDVFIVKACSALEAYFAGQPRAYDGGYSLHGTAFQQAVWTVLQTIPHGGTSTYSAIARALNAPKATRAVGAAVGRNPVSILIPCHRVLGANGKLTGFAGGLERKQALLALEGLRLVA